MQPTSDSIYNIGKRFEQLDEQLAVLIQATKAYQATKDYQHPHKQLYTEQEMNTLKRLFITYELNETVIYEGQVVQIVDVKNNIYYVDLNGEKLRTTSMDLQKINY
jgi:hypothetical protein